MKLDLLTNATVIDDAVRFVAAYTKHDDNEVEKKLEPVMSSTSIAREAVEGETRNQVF